MQENKSIITVAFKHPAGLSVLFLTEMWERFGFYIVQTLLILYLTQAFSFSDGRGYAIGGAFTAFIYISSIVGGYIADKLLGFRNSVIFGGILLSIGYGLLAAFTVNTAILYMSLGIIIVGTGFFKPNISSLLGSLYEKNTAQRDAGFTLFYMGINIGVILATLSAGYIKLYFGWWAGFALASIGLLAGLATFIAGLQKLQGHGIAPQKNIVSSKWLAVLRSKTSVIVGSLLAIVLFSYLVENKMLADWLLSAVGIFILTLLLVIAFRQADKTARNKLLALIVLLLASIIFWAVFFQLFYSVNLYIDRDIDRQIFHFQIPTIAYVSCESFFILLLGPFLARLWLNLKDKNPSTPLKFALASFSIGLAFLLLTESTLHHNAAGLVDSWWIVASYLLVTIGEMLLSPIGLSMITLLAPAELVSMMMGVWFMTLGFGGKLAGVLANLSSIPSGITNPLVESQYYGHAFFKYAILSFIVAIILLALTPFLRKLIVNHHSV